MDEAKVVQVAARQHGLVSLAQARELGYSAKMIKRRLASSSWSNVRAGVYCVGAAPPSFEQAVLAAVLAARFEAVASHATAARLWGFDVEATAIELSAWRPHWSRLQGVTGHRTTRFLAVEQSRLRGVPATSLSRTLVDLSGRFSARELGVMVDEGLRRRNLRLHHLALCASGLRPAPGRVLSRVQAVLRERLDGYDPGESELAMRYVRALVAAGVSEPAIEHRVTLGARRCRIDLAYPEQRLAIEVDGWDFHRTRSAFESDRARANDLVLAGWRILRFTSTMTDETAVAAVTQALAQKVAV